MDAARLVAQAERTLGGDPRPEEVIAEAWQAYELTEAVVRMVRGGHRPGLGDGTPAVSRDESTGGSGEAACGASAAPSDPSPTEVAAVSSTAVLTGAGVSRVARLTTVRHPAQTVPALESLLGEVGQALIGLIGTAADEQAYWHCVEALDAVEEAKDRLRSLGRGGPG